jgi:hypothetical protein
MPGWRDHNCEFIEDDTPMKNTGMKPPPARRFIEMMVKGWASREL